MDNGIMKTLNEYIKESLLDDEEVLIEKTKEIAKNPFSRLYNLRPEDWENNEKLLLEIIRVLEMPKTVYTHSVTRTGNSSSEEPFKPECLGVESFLFNKPGHPQRYNQRWLYITYDMLKHRDPSKKSLNPYKLIEISIIGENNEYKNKNFLHDGRIFVKIYSKIDVKTIFGSISPITKLFKKWNKSYGVMIQ
jgi:hypothetical protein